MHESGLPVHRLCFARQLPGGAFTPVCMQEIWKAPKTAGDIMGKSGSEQKILRHLRAVVWDWSVHKIDADTAMWNIIAILNVIDVPMKRQCKTCPRGKSLKQKKRRPAAC